MEHRRDQVSLIGTHHKEELLPKMYLIDDLILGVR